MINLRSRNILILILFLISFILIYFLVNTWQLKISKEKELAQLSRKSNTIALKEIRKFGYYDILTEFQNIDNLKILKIYDREENFCKSEISISGDANYLIEKLDYINKKENVRSIESITGFRNESMDTYDTIIEITFLNNR